MPRISAFSLIALFSLILFSHKAIGQVSVEDQLKDVIADWYNSISKGQMDHFRDLLTDDFQLIAFGSRFDKNQITEMSKDYSDITYSLTNVRTNASGDLAFITFDVEMKCNYKNKPIVGKAMEVYLLRKIANQWKVNTKTIVMIEDKK